MDGEVVVHDPAIRQPASSACALRKAIRDCLKFGAGCSCCTRSACLTQFADHIGEVLDARAALRSLTPEEQDFHLGHIVYGRRLDEQLRSEGCEPVMDTSEEEANPVNCECEDFPTSAEEALPEVNLQTSDSDAAVEQPPPPKRRRLQGGRGSRLTLVSSSAAKCAKGP